MYQLRLWSLSGVFMCTQKDMWMRTADAWMAAALSEISDAVNKPPQPIKKNPRWLLLTKTQQRYNTRPTNPTRRSSSTLSPMETFPDPAAGRSTDWHSTFIINSGHTLLQRLTLARQHRGRWLIVLPYANMQAAACKMMKGCLNVVVVVFPGSNRTAEQVAEQQLDFCHIGCFSCRRTNREACKRQLSLATAAAADTIVTIILPSDGQHYLSPASAAKLALFTPALAVSPSSPTPFNDLFPLKTWRKKDTQKHNKQTKPTLSLFNGTNRPARLARREGSKGRDVSTGFLQLRASVHCKFKTLLVVLARLWRAEWYM